MPIPTATSTLVYSEFDEVEVLVRRPRECLTELKKLQARRKSSLVVVENTPAETYLVMLAYGCTIDGPYPDEDFADLIRSVGADPSRWVRPVDRLTAIRHLVLPLANYINLALGLGNNQNWDRGIAIMTRANAKLAKWFERRAEASSDIEHLGEGRRADGAGVLEAWGESAARNNYESAGFRDGRTLEGSSGYQRQIADYEAQLDDDADRSIDALIASLAGERLRMFKRSLAFRHDAVSIGPGNVFDYNDALRGGAEAQRETDRAYLSFLFTHAACGVFGITPVGRVICTAMDVMDMAGLEGSTPPHQRQHGQNTTTTGTSNTSSNVSSTETTPTSSEFMTTIQDSRSAREQREQAERDQERWDDMRTVRVAPHDYYDNDSGGLHTFKEEVLIRLQWNSRQSETENSRMTFAEILEEAAKRTQRLINVHPDNEEIRSDPQQVMAEAIARINRVTNPGRIGGGT